MSELILLARNSKSPFISWLNCKSCAIIFAIIGDPRFFTDGRHIQRRQRASSWIGEAKISDWICKLAAGVNKREMPSVLEYEHLMPPLSPQDPNCDD